MPSFGPMNQVSLAKEYGFPLVSSIPGGGKEEIVTPTFPSRSTGLRFTREKRRLLTSLRMSSTPYWQVRERKILPSIPPETAPSCNWSGYQRYFPAAASKRIVTGSVSLLKKTTPLKDVLRLDRLFDCPMILRDRCWSDREQSRPRDPDSTRRRQKCSESVLVDMRRFSMIRQRQREESKLTKRNFTRIELRPRAVSSSPPNSPHLSR